MITRIKNNERVLNGYSSIFLDQVRLFCALIVVFGHCSLVLVPGWLNKVPVFDLGHGAVVVFFVLSGFVIAHTTSSKKRTAKTYLASRFSRLYSIYIPAILVTILCALFSFLINPGVYFQYDRGNNLARYLLTLVFCNELWFTSGGPPMNGPFWSLSFEFWYYVLFALICYKASRLKGQLLLVLVCLFIGPKILAMFPIWCFGWLAYKMKPVNINIHTARSISFALLVFAFILAKVLPGFPGKVGYRPFYMANGFITDMLTGIFAAASLWFLPTGIERPLEQSALITRFRFYANLTYPVYLLHFPILIFYSSIMQKYNLSDGVKYFSGLIATLFLCFVLGAYFEKRKQWWYGFFGKMFHRQKAPLIFENALLGVKDPEEIS